MNQVRPIKTASSRVRSAIDRAGMIQQREQLKETLIHKFQQDYSQANPKLQEMIKQIVQDYFVSEKVNENTLKQLKETIIQACTNMSMNKSKRLQSAQTYGQNAQTYGQSAQSYGQKHVTINDHKDYPDDQSEAQSVVAPSLRSQKSYLQQQDDKKSHHHQQDDKKSVQSYSSSVRGPKSVYVPDEEDEWTALVKFDTEMFKKEQELEFQRQREFKLKMKQELDRQLEEKRKRKIEDQVEENAFVRLNEHQLVVYDQKEIEKKRQVVQKQRIEKAQRDKQVHDEERRKAIERRQGREMDNLLVRRIKEELTIEQQEQANRREQEKDRLHQMISENEYNKKRVEEETVKEKKQEVELQEKYTRLLDQMEHKRENDKADREDKIKRLMSGFAQTVVKDQLNLIKQEDDKMFRATIAKSQSDQNGEDQKQYDIRQQKLEMRKFLNTQMEDKRHRKQEEDQLDRRQADVWRNDLQNYNNHESQKSKYIKNVNLRHQDILKQQIYEKSYKSSGKRMTATELMHNKPIFKEMAETSNQIKMKKVNIGEDL